MGFDKAKKWCVDMGFQLPIIQAPMAGGVTTPELVAAVSNAGGLGSLGAGYMSPTQIREAIREVRKLTEKPFAVNLFVPEVHESTEQEIRDACHIVNRSCPELNCAIDVPKKPYAPIFEEQLSIVLEENIKFFSFTFGMPQPHWLERLSANETITIGTATNLTEAQTLVASGIHIIVAQGKEAGGHRGSFLGSASEGLLELKQLISELTAHVNIPVIAAGGIMQGHAIADMLHSGAAAVQLGTAFLTCYESGAHAKYKDILLSQTHDTTVLTSSFSGKLARGIENKFTKRMSAKQESVLPYPIQNALTRPMRTKAAELGNIDFMSLWAGQSAHLCRAMSAEALMHILMLEAENA
jgi:nitronate monooxygenase